MSTIVMTHLSYYLYVDTAIWNFNEEDTLHTYYSQIGDNKILVYQTQDYSKETFWK